MKDDFSQLAGFVDSLLRGRRPSRFAATPEEAEAMRMAALLRASVAGADLPDPRFLARLHARLQPAAPPLSRRRLLGLAGAAAVGLVAGGAGDRLLAPSDHATEVVPDHGRWLAVAKTAEVVPGALVAFDTGGLRGFLSNRAGALRAVSGVCSHLGCTLSASEHSDRLDCPCHRTSFALDGGVLSHQLPAAPRRLPSIRVRINGDVIEVLAP
ncbi:MAG: Rieske (2Fe-2S) protein [Candidatus Dormibacteraeota bacterium]|nr:Rieske (2Fe-2S) protein [Candidatus Dormibacteraeota bacterium]